MRLRFSQSKEEKRRKRKLIGRSSRKSNRSCKAASKERTAFRFYKDRRAER
jgi:hypothetical protein